VKFPQWSGTVVGIASGPSLTAQDCELVRASGLPVIVTNTTFRLCPWADALFGYDVNWWTWHINEVRATFRGMLFAHGSNHAKHVQSASAHPRYRDFYNSGACAIALVVACGAKRVVMLGYDCQLTGGKTHHHGNHPQAKGFWNCGSLKRWPEDFAKLAQWARGTEIVNASRVSALECFPRVTLEDALEPVPA
jgi:hypothetical protein